MPHEAATEMELQLEEKRWEHVLDMKQRQMAACIGDIWAVKKKLTEVKEKLMGKGDVNGG